MGCGLEHLSNCHGEITGLLFALSLGGIWFRTQYQVTKAWMMSKLTGLMRKG